MHDWETLVRGRLRGLNLAPARETAIADELADHLEQRYRDLLARGTDADAAAKSVLDELENEGILADRLKQTRQPIDRAQGSVADGFWHDCRVAIRMMKKRPGFTAAVAGMLALGVAGNAAMFSIFNGLFLRPLPFRAFERLVDLTETAPKWNLVRVGVSAIDFGAWQKGSSSVVQMASFRTGQGGNLTLDNAAPQRIRIAEVTHELLDVFGLTPVVGRNFAPEEDRPGGRPVILLGYDLWQRVFHGDTSVTGRVLKLSERPFTVIGVLPREAMIPPGVDAWVPLTADMTQPGPYYLGVVGRLKAGVTAQQARADLTRIHRGLVKTPGDDPHEDTSPVVGPLRDRYLGDYKTVSRILLGAVAVVLLIACVNIAGLMLVRGEARSREIAIRTAIGASRGRITRQLLIESLALAVAGGLLGAAVGKVFLAGLVSLMPGDLPKWVAFELDWRIVLFCAGVTGLAALLCGLAPAMQAAAVDTRSWIQETARSTFSRRKRATLSALVAGEVALALMLSASTALVLQAFRKVMREDPGFQPANLLTFSLRPASSKLSKPEQIYAFYSALLEKLRAIPGVADASAASIMPLDGHTGYFFEAESGWRPGKNEGNPVVLHITALPGYLKTMGIVLKSGREFDERDNLPGAPKVVMVNETFARLYWRTSDVVGKRVSYYPGVKNWFRIVGVFRDIRHYGLDAEVRPEVFVSFPIAPLSGMTIGVRGKTDAGSLAAPAREVLRQLDPDLPMYDVQSMDERLGRSLWIRRAYSSLFVAFASISLLLAVAGVYGVISFAVSQRTREIGIRIALGARPGQVMGETIREGMLLVSIGVAVGAAGAFLTAGLLQSMLFGVSPHDTSAYIAAALVLALAGLAANFFPATRAAGIEPMQALRSD